MRVLGVLRQRPIAILWAGQVLSALGDRFYGIALMWIAVRVAGGHAGLVAAAQLLSTLSFGLAGGVWADRWDRQRTMIVADLGRAIAVGALPVFAATHTLDLSHLVVVGVVLGAFDAVYEPALFASLPALVASPDDLHPTNGLMDSTARIARAVGPSFAGWVAAHVSLLHFFTLDAISFAASAMAIASLGRRFVWRAPRADATGMSIVDDLTGALRSIRAHRALAWSLASLAAANATWSVSFVVGAPLFTSRVQRGDVGAYGLILSAYGIGNVISNVVVGSMLIKRRAFVLFLGNLVFGLGFVIVAGAGSLGTAMAGAALAAVGGPMGDLMLLAMIQRELPADQLGKVASLRMILAGAGGAIGLILAGPLFDHVSVRTGILVGAFASIVTGMIGLFRFAALRAEGHDEVP